MKISRRIPKITLSKKINQYPWSTRKLIKLKKRKMGRVNFVHSIVYRGKTMTFKYFRTYKAKTKQLFKRYFASQMTDRQCKKLFRSNTRYRLTFKQVLNSEFRLDTLVFRLYMLPDIFTAREIIKKNYFYLNNNSVANPNIILGIGDILSPANFLSWQFLYQNMLCVTASLKKYFSRIFFKFSFPFVIKRRRFRLKEHGKYKHKNLGHITKNIPERIVRRFIFGRYKKLKGNVTSSIKPAKKYYFKEPKKGELFKEKRLKEYYLKKVKLTYPLVFQKHQIVNKFKKNKVIFYKKANTQFKFLNKINRAKKLTSSFLLAKRFAPKTFKKRLLKKISKGKDSKNKKQYNKMRQEIKIERFKQGLWRKKIKLRLASNIKKFNLFKNKKKKYNNLRSIQLRKSLKTKRSEFYKWKNKKKIHRSARKTLKNFFKVLPTLIKKKKVKKFIPREILRFSLKTKLTNLKQHKFLFFKRKFKKIRKMLSPSKKKNAFLFSKIVLDKKKRKNFPSSFYLKTVGKKSKIRKKITPQLRYLNLFLKKKRRRFKIVVMNCNSLQKKRLLVIKEKRKKKPYWRKFVPKTPMNYWQVNRITKKHVLLFRYLKKFNNRYKLYRGFQQLKQISWSLLMTNEFKPKDLKSKYWQKTSFLYEKKRKRLLCKNKGIVLLKKKTKGAFLTLLPGKFHTRILKKNSQLVKKILRVKRKYLRLKGFYRKYKKMKVGIIFSDNSLQFRPIQIKYKKINLLFKHRPIAYYFTEANFKSLEFTIVSDVDFLFFPYRTFLDFKTFAFLN